jgi:phage-related protein
MAQTMLDNLGGSMTLLSSAFDGVKKKIYNAISEPLNSLVKQITSNIMPALSGILTGDGGAGGKLADGISNLISNALKSANKILPGAVGALGTILGAIGTALVRQAPEATAAAEKLLEIILDGVIGAIPGMIKGGARIVKSLADGLGDLLIHVADSIVDELPEILGAVSAAVPTIVKALLRMTEKIAAAIPEIVKSIAVFLPELVQGVADLIVTQTPIIIQSVITIFNGIVQALPEIIQSLVDALPSLIQTVTDFIANNAPMVLESILMLVQALVQAAPQIAAAIYPMIPQIVDILVEGFMNFLPVWIETARTMFTMLAAALPGLWKDVKASGDAIFEEWKTNIFDRAAKAFGEIWDHIKDKVTPVGEKIGNAVGDAFKTAVNTVLECVEEKLNTIPYTVNAILDKLNAVPGINLSPMGTVSLPRLARGGVIDKATIAQLGEAGREAVIPLDGDRAALKEIADLLRSGMTSGHGGSPVYNGGNVTLTQNISSPKALSNYEIWRQTRNMLNLVEAHLSRR